jgi:cupin fold WbuC family metalloprotein
MRAKKINQEVFFAEKSDLRVKSQDIENLKKKSRRNARRRIRLCMHNNTKDSLHEMFIVHAKGAYIRPHKHINKAESLHILEGDADVVIFGDKGNIIRIFRMGDYLSKKPFYFRYPGQYYHMLLIRSDYLVFHEVTNGPFRKKDTVFAPWSPQDTDICAAKKFVQKVTRSC